MDSYHLNLTPGTIYTMEPEHPVSITEGTVIENMSGTRRLEVKKLHKKILLREPDKKTYFHVLPQPDDKLKESPQYLCGSPIYLSVDSVSLIIPDAFPFFPAPFFDHQNVFAVRKRGDLVIPNTKAQQKALETLRELLSEKEFRKFIKYGFITVDSASGRTYQIYMNQLHVKIWEKGEITGELCAYIKNKKIPPIDKLIAFKTIIETDENEFLQMGNYYNMKRKVA